MHPSFEAYYLQILKLLSNASPRPPLIHSFHHVHEAVIGVHMLLMLETHDANNIKILGFGNEIMISKQVMEQPNILECFKDSKGISFFHTTLQAMTIKLMEH